MSNEEDEPMSDHREGYTSTFAATAFLVRGCLRCGVLIGSSATAKHDAFHDSLPASSGVSGTTRKDNGG